MSSPPSVRMNPKQHAVRHLAAFLLIFLPAVAGSANAKESTLCTSNQPDGDTVAGRVAAVSAGTVTGGSPIGLRQVLDNPASACNEGSCAANAGANGLKLGQSGSWVCISVPGKGKLGTQYGWIPAERWHASNSNAQSPDQWVGVWQNEWAKITIESTDANQLHLQGNAIWGPEANPHFGGFDVTAVPENGLVVNESDGCQIAVRVVGDFLIAADNHACGGMNVTFNGMYRLRHH